MPYELVVEGLGATELYRIMDFPGSSTMDPAANNFVHAFIYY